MKKTIALILACTLCLFGLVGCAGNKNSGGTGSTTANNESVSSTNSTENTSAESESTVSETEASSTDSSTGNANSSTGQPSTTSSKAGSSTAGTSSTTPSVPQGATGPTGKTYTPVAKSLSGTISMSGSTSVYPATAALTEAFKKLYPNVKISITNVTGSGAGLSDANNKKVSFGMRSSEWADADATKNPNIVAHTIALDGVALVVNTANPLTNITVAQLFGIYGVGATITNWNTLAPSYNHPISVVSRESGSGTRTCFQDVMKGLGSAYELKSGYDTQGNSVISASTDAVKTSVKNNANAIGYMSLGSVDSSVKKLQFNGIEATEANVINGSYKFSRPFLLLSNKTKTMSAAEKEFLKFALSKDGQEIVKKGGFISLDDASIQRELGKIG